MHKSPLEPRLTVVDSGARTFHFADGAIVYFAKTSQEWRQIEKNSRNFPAAKDRIDVCKAILAAKRLTS